MKYQSLSRAEDKNGIPSFNSWFSNYNKLVIYNKKEATFSDDSFVGKGFFKNISIFAYFIK